MDINNFKLERYFALHEFSAKYLLSSSDCDGYAMDYILSCADSKEKELWEKLTLGYTESTGHPLLKEAILKHYDESLTPENVLVGSPGELAFILMNVLLGVGDHAIVVSPSYQSLYEVARSLGTDLSFWTPTIEDNEWRFSVEDLKNLIKPSTKLIVINFPHNPTGATLSESELQEIVSMAREKDIYIYSDEMYRNLNLIPDVRVSASVSAIADIYEKGISLWGMAKSFALAGLRIGWFVSQDVALLEKIASFKDYLSICSSAPSEVLAIIGLNHSENFIAPNIHKIKSNIAAFEKYFYSGQNLFKALIPPKAGSVAFLPISCEENTSLEFSNNLVKDQGIMTIPAEMFDYDGKYLRIGFGRENFPEILKLLTMTLNIY